MHRPDRHSSSVNKTAKQRHVEIDVREYPSGDVRCSARTSIPYRTKLTKSIFISGLTYVQRCFRPAFAVVGTAFSGQRLCICHNFQGALTSEIQTINRQRFIKYGIAWNIRVFRCGFSWLWCLRSARRKRQTGSKLSSTTTRRSCGGRSLTPTAFSLSGPLRCGTGRGGNVSLRWAASNRSRPAQTLKKLKIRRPHSTYRTHVFLDVSTVIVVTYF